MKKYFLLSLFVWSIFINNKVALAAASPKLGWSTIVTLIEKMHLPEDMIEGFIDAFKDESVDINATKVRNKEGEEVLSFTNYVVNTLEDEGRCTALFEILLKHRLDLHVKDTFGLNCLDFAIVHGKKKLTYYLFQKKVLPTERGFVAFIGQDREFLTYVYPVIPEGAKGVLYSMLLINEDFDKALLFEALGLLTSKGILDEFQKYEPQKYQAYLAYKANCNKNK